MVRGDACDVSLCIFFIIVITYIIYHVAACIINTQTHRYNIHLMYYERYHNIYVPDELIYFNIFQHTLSPCIYNNSAHPQLTWKWTYDTWNCKRAKISLALPRTAAI